MVIFFVLRSLVSEPGTLPVETTISEENYDEQSIRQRREGIQVWLLLGLSEAEDCGGSDRHHPVALAEPGS